MYVEREGVAHAYLGVGETDPALLATLVGRVKIMYNCGMVAAVVLEVHGQLYSGNHRLISSSTSNK